MKNMNTQNTGQSSIIHYFNSLVASVSRTGVSRVTPPSNHPMSSRASYNFSYVVQNIFSSLS